MAILVTGGTGFVGLNLVEALLARGDSVVSPSDGPLPKMAEPVFTRLPGTADPGNWLRARRPSGRGCGYGSSAHLLLKRETTYGQAATGNYIRMPFNRCNLGSEQGLIDDPVLGQGRRFGRSVRGGCPPR